jgi:hypothetical protein
MAKHRDLTWSQLSTHLDLRLAIGILAVVALVAALGGFAHSTQAQISITGEDGWVYGVPLDVHWTDAGGVWHEGDRPASLPPVGEVPAPVTFAATLVTINGMTWRPVVWVSCHNRSRVGTPFFRMRGRLACAARLRSSSTLGFVELPSEPIPGAKETLEGKADQDRGSRRSALGPHTHEFQVDALLDQ